MHVAADGTHNGPHLWVCRFGPTMLRAQILGPTGRLMLACNFQQVKAPKGSPRLDASQAVAEAQGT